MSRVSQRTKTQSKDLVPVDEKALALLLEQELQNALDGIDPRPPRIKVSREAPVFMLPDGSTTKVLKGVIVYHHKARGYWYEEGEKIPDCSSMDGRIGRTKEGEEKLCRDCQFNVFGTDLKGGAGKACKEMRWIFLLQSGEIIPSKLSIPPTSIKVFDEFITALAQKKIVPVQKVVALKLESTEGQGFKYSKLSQPEIIDDVPNRDIPGLLKMRDSAVAAAKKAGIEAEDYYDIGKEVAMDEVPF